MYELYDDCTTMFFYRQYRLVLSTLYTKRADDVDVSYVGNKHIMVDLGTGNNNKINWAIENKQEVKLSLTHPISRRRKR